MPKSDTLSITDNRTGKSYDVPITDDTIRAMDLRQPEHRQGNGDNLSPKITEA
jgi:hypothetical protein